ncbi:hypothetical protein CTAYLR_004167 [Chrysophaeum taylorii]|uniref:Symplekin C-terminal domain-containing protein n=1 Tax=Chrysophaeum taylorii TaxID=2483200 RepID=A0AAD7UL74_9STRA|nr:hypothetical protein CTAYLR_004167 [Chrysophaeum taylorii]
MEDVVRQQTRALLESAATSVGKEEKIRKIAQLVEIARFRADAALVEEIVASVCEHVTDKSGSVRRSVLDFVDAVCATDKASVACGAKALEVASYLAAAGVGDGAVGVSVKALRVAARALGVPRFRRREEEDVLDAVSRERLVGSLGMSPSVKYVAAAAEAVLAVVLRDADYDYRSAASKKARAGASTKEALGALATAAGSLGGEKRGCVLDAVAVALAKYFVLVHRELVSAAISALEADGDAAAVRCCASALHSAETARQKTPQGVITGAATRLEVALQRAGHHDLAERALEAARSGEGLKLQPKRSREEDEEEEEDDLVEEPPEKKAKTPPADVVAVVEPEEQNPPNFLFALAPEHRLAIALEILEARALPAPPEPLGRASGATIRTLEQLRVAVDAAVAAFAAPAASKAPPPDVNKPRRAKDPRVRRERPSTPPSVVVVDDDRQLDDDEKQVAAVTVPVVEEEEAFQEEEEEEEDEEEAAAAEDGGVASVSAAEAGEVTRGEVEPKALSAAQEQYMRRATLERLATTKIAEPALRGTRNAVLARLARYELRRVDADSLKNLLDSLTYDAGDEKKKTAEEWKEVNAARCEAALSVLYEAYAQNDDELYDALFAAIIPSLVDALSRGNANERTLFSEALVAAPRFPQKAVGVLVDATCLAADDDDALVRKKILLGLSALRDVALARPRCRASCANAALDLTRRPAASQEVRDKAVRLASNVLFPVVAIQPYVRDFAMKNARDRLSDARAIDDARRELALLVALCVKDLSLLPSLVDVVVLFSRDDDDHPVRQALDAELVRLAPALATAHGCEAVLAALAAPARNDVVVKQEQRDDSSSPPPPLVVVVREDAGENGHGASSSSSRDAIVARLVQVLGDLPASRRGKGLWAGVEALFKARPGADGVKFVAPALNDATAAQFLEVLPHLLVHLDDEQVAKAFRRAAAETDNLDAPQVLVALHRVEGVPVKRVTEVLSVCLAARDVFGAVTIRDALERLTTPPEDANLRGAPAAKTLPQLLMRTAILAIKMYPSQLSAFVANTAIWHNPQLWKGFVMCADMLADENGPNCFQALVQLPAAQLAHVLKVSAKLKLPLKRYAEKENRNRATISPPVLRLLGVRVVPSGR